MNRKTAEKMIRNALVQQAEERAAGQRSGQRQRHHQLERGAPVRVHTLDRNGELEDSDE
jgi:protein subunit release factor B